MRPTRKRYRKAMFEPNTRSVGMDTERFEAIIRLELRGPCACKERVVFAGFPIVNGMPHVHQHNALVHNPRCPVHGAEGSDPIEWHL